jgi:hypothetical protein
MWGALMAFTTKTYRNYRLKSIAKNNPERLKEHQDYISWMEKHPIMTSGLIPYETKKYYKKYKKFEDQSYKDYDDWHKNHPLGSRHRLKVDNIAYTMNT